MQLPHDEVEDIKSSLKTVDDVKAAVEEAVKNAHSTFKPEETEAYKKLKQELEDVRYLSELKTQLKDEKVKDKFLDDVIAKIKREEKLDTQLPKLREDFAEYFEEAGEPQPQPPKPVFSGDPKPAPQGGGPKPIPKIF